MARPGFDEGDQTGASRDAADRKRLEHDLRLAIAHNRLVLYYQRRSAPASLMPLGMEAMLRWPDHRHGLSRPSAILPVAEGAGLLGPVSKWVFRHAGADARLWPPSCRVIVPVSVEQLRDPALAGQIGNAFTLESEMPLERLGVEVSEAALLAMQEPAWLALAALRDSGAAVLAGGFGAGCTSLSLLRDAPLTGITLDRACLRDVPASREDAVFIRTLVDAAHSLGLTVCAKGVDTEAQHDFLAGIACDAVQGHRIGLAEPAAAIAARFPYMAGQVPGGHA
jgi:EAL domain-containing protein (putative c-di-GMP-specific phosphodiesterase class I)